MARLNDHLALQARVREVLRAHDAPVAPWQVEEKAGFWGVQCGNWRMIFARCNGRLLFLGRTRRERGSLCSWL